MNKLSKILRVLTYLTSLVIISFGIRLILNTGLGVGAFDVLVFGTNKKFGLSCGQSQAVLSSIALTIYSIWNRKFPPILAFMTNYLIGWCVDNVSICLSNVKGINLWHDYALLADYSILFVGIIVLSLGVNFLLLSKIGIVSHDLIVLTLMEKFKWTIRRAKSVVEIVVAILGALLGGPVGIGTVAVTFLLGPLLEVERKISFKIIKKFKTRFEVFELYEGESKKKERLSA